MSHPLLLALNPQQQQVVQATAGPLLVLAGAGSGKTRTLTHRIAYLLHEGLAHPEEIMAVTFTNKAAREMRERITTLLEGRSPLPTAIGTFHGLGAKLLRAHAQQTNRSARFTILDTKESEQIIKKALVAQNLSSKEWSPSNLRQAISKAKNQLVTPNELLAQAHSRAEEVVAKTFVAYQQLVIAHDAYDFDDLLVETVRLLQNQPELRQHYQQRWRYLSVDEYQDTNPVQEQLLQLVLNQAKNICVVGDDYQAIYSWRGAKVDHILRFETTFPQCTTIYLTQNYRSTPAILAAANHIIAENIVQKHKELWTAETTTQPVQLVTLQSDRHEAMWVRQQIQSYIQEGGSPADCAILYRTNAQSRLFEEQFIMHQLPYTIVGGWRFYDRAEIKDVMALLQLWVNPQASLALTRLTKVLLKGIGPKTLRAWEEAAQTQQMSIVQLLQTAGTVSARQHTVLKPLLAALTQTQTNAYPTVAELLADLVEYSGYAKYIQQQPDGEERWQNIEELLNVAAMHTDPHQFVEEVALISDVDTVSETQAQITCMTLHAAKGLEFKRVWLVGCEEGLLPHSNSLDSSASLEEERRLLYVGITRAREYLALSGAQTRFVRGESLPQLPSRFLKALPVEVERLTPLTTMDMRPANPLADFGVLPPSQVSDGETVLLSYESGDFVTHPTFGQGVVIQSNGTLLTCVFAGSGVKTIDATILPMPH